MRYFYFEDKDAIKLSLITGMCLLILTERVRWLGIATESGGLFVSKL